jgi:hypothetical protein
VSYDGDGELFSVFLERYGLFPFVERPSKKDLAASIAPGEGLPYIGFLKFLPFDDCAAAFDFAW